MVANPSCRQNTHLILGRSSVEMTTGNATYLLINH